MLACSAGDCRSFRGHEYKAAPAARRSSWDAARRLTSRQHSGTRATRITAITAAKKGYLREKTLSTASVPGCVNVLVVISVKS